MHDPRYRQLFFREAARRLDELEDCVASVGTPDFAGLMRGLHTLKGMAATMGAAPMVVVAHAAEDLCARGQSDPQAWGDDGQTLLLEGLDRLRAQASAVAEGAEPPDGQRFDERVRAVRLRLTDGGTVALDRVIDEGEYLVSPAPFPLNRMPWIRGTAVAPEGHIFFLVEP